MIESSTERSEGKGSFLLSFKIIFSRKASIVLANLIF